jgi:(1->4)-alpha-D-glucan 1-alpha-D-glucosylmutase
MSRHDAPTGARIPTATYRVQFNAGFTFGDARRIVPYLAELGVSDLYASPYLQARPGSLHGYDIVDHAALNVEVGTEGEHADLCAELRAHGMGQLLDIVPNHMGIGGAANGWWNDVLEHGPSSPYAAYFDIDWNPRKPELAGKVLLPILGDQYGRVLERGELRLVYEDGRFFLDHFETRLPVAPAPTAAVLHLAAEGLEGELAADHPDRMELESIATALARLPPRRTTDPASVAERRRERTVSQRRLGALHARSAAVGAALDAAVAAFNGTVGDPASFDRLDELLDDQAYRLAFWRVAAEEINYRRFFDVNELAGVRVEVPQVFADTHRLVLRLVREGKVTGLRIDHPDGLHDPRGYLRELQAETAGIDAAEPFYLLVEKILTGEEELPADWPVTGTVGYEFLHRLNALFVPRGSERAMDRIYREFTGQDRSFHDLAYERRRLILRTSLISELTVLATLLNRISETDRRSRDFTYGSLLDALRELISAFPVYRTYIDAAAGRISDADRGHVERAVRTARRRNRGISGEVFEFLGDVLLLRWPESLDEAARGEYALFVMKLQQLTGPVMAKGVEDTTFYVYNRLVSLNEVGGEPDRFGIEPDDLHRWLAARAERWPHALSSGSTHDTKRSEDVRARIDVLAEIPETWAERVYAWDALNAPHLGSDDGQEVPSANDRYLLYQTLVGAWPLEGAAADGAFAERIRAYMEKATREAKEHTSWINPDEAYDEGLAAFVAAILAPGSPFLDDFVAFHSTVAETGMVNALSQTLVRLAAPGVPDVYQGQESWDLSLVDPDNRRPVDFERRRAMLASLRAAAGSEDGEALARELVREWRDGRIKMHVVHRALRLRGERRALFTDGAYLPLAAGGARAEHLFAFARTHSGDAAIAVVPRLVATLTRDGGTGVPEAADYDDTALAIPEALRGRYVDAFTGARVELGGSAGVGALLADFPVALLARER